MTTGDPIRCACAGAPGDGTHPAAARERAAAVRGWHHDRSHHRHRPSHRRRSRDATGRRRTHRPRRHPLGVVAVVRPVPGVAQRGGDQRPRVRHRRVRRGRGPHGRHPRDLRDRPAGRPRHPGGTARRSVGSSSTPTTTCSRQGDEALWDSPPFVAPSATGRLYGRGTGDDKAGVLCHTGRAACTARRSSGDDLGGLGVTLFVEGEEEYGSRSFGQFLADHADALTAT
ncbi:MAG: M20/M25/M40 family metallo-hydrolase [Propionicimonas sp.]|uniref:M20/M25/M40 family metallo-hydrolase n=1 Tax=Propionicimonas sp. TaxID=1955623 RepID=UPI003D0A4491